MDMLKKGAGKESKNYHRGYDFRVRNKEKGFWSLMLPWTWGIYSLSQLWAWPIKKADRSLLGEATKETSWKHKSQRKRKAYHPI